MNDTTTGAYLPAALRTGRAWGFGINLYALRSRRNWGIGDFTDLANFIGVAKALGAGTVGLNPLHALHYVEPEAASPYSPVSRYFRNPVYIDVEAVPEFASSHERARALRTRVRQQQFREMLAMLRAEPMVAYRRVARAKFSALEECYAALRESRGPRLRAFTYYVDRAGERLETFAVHEALTEHFAREDGHIRGWPTWPGEYHDSRGEAARDFALKHRRRVEYFKYLQWLIDEQLTTARERAQDMAVGLYLDLAVGVDVNSADVWDEPEAFVLDHTVGAPPDELGPLGQDWGLPPPAPHALARNGGSAFAELLRANMAHAAALRLDHAMAFQRLFWIPRGGKPRDGAYRDYPFDELLAVAARESERAKCAIVGEDLGTVPPGFRERMAREGVLSYRVLLFERDAGSHFAPPEAYPSLGLATATTHDLPPLAGWIMGRDIEIRKRLGMVDGEQADRAQAERRVDVSRLVEALQRAGTLGDEAFAAAHAHLDAHSADTGHYAELVRAAYAFLAASPARMVLVQLDDVLLETDQINLPGTFVEYPNWRRKNARDLEDLTEDPCVAAVAAAVRERIGG